MCRCAMTMTMSVVSVVVFLLGLSLGGTWTASALRSAGSGDRVVIIDTVVLTVLALTGIALTAASVVVSRTSRRISVPFIYLAAEAEQLGSGRVHPRLRPSGVEGIDLVQAELVCSTERVAGRIAVEWQSTSDASHQLRTPPTSLSLCLEEVELLAGEEEMRAETHTCPEQVERLTGVVEDLLKVSRRSGGGTTEVPHLKGIFAQQRREWESAFEQAGRIITFPDEISHPVLAMPGSLAQMLATVIESSLRYGAGTTSVSVRGTNGGHAVFISIADGDEGVAEDIAPHVLERHVSGYGSTGVGLALVKDSTEADGGRIKLSQRSPAVFSILLNAVPKSLDLNSVLPQGALVLVGRRRRL